MNSDAFCRDYYWRDTTCVSARCSLVALYNLIVYTYIIVKHICTYNNTERKKILKEIYIYNISKKVVKVNDRPRSHRYGDSREGPKQTTGATKATRNSAPIANCRQLATTCKRELLDPPPRPRPSTANASTPAIHPVRS